MESPRGDDSKAIAAALLSQKVFKGCDPELVQQIADEAVRWTPGKGHEIPVQDGMPLLIVASGSLQICVGGGPAAQAGRGTVVGFAGLFGLLGAAASARNQPRLVSIVSAVDGEDLDDDTVKPEDDEEDEGRQELRRQFDLPAWSLYCKRAVRDGIQNLAPHTVDFEKLHGSDKHTAGLRMEILDAISFQRALTVGQEKKNGCVLACVSLEVIQEIFAGTESAACFEAACKSVIAKFKALTRFASFPGVPPEVIWMLAEHSEVQVFQKDDLILREGICGVPESMIIIESGTADVEMVMFDREILEARGCRIAKLLPGAILGDACFLESWVARPCSVVARERVQVLHISSRALLEVMACYPGMASIYMSRSRQTSVVLQQSLTRPADVLAGMKLFYGMEPGFIRLLANIAERKMNFLGDVVKEEGSTDRTLRLQEFGKVRAETEAEGCVSITDVGTVLGEKMFLGWRERSQATFRVATPIAVMLWIAQHHFENLLENNPSEHAYFRALEETDGGTEAVKHKAEDLELFRGCGRSFTQDIGSYIGRRAYKPGQAIVVQKAADEGSLFIVTGGRAAVIINSETRQEISSGDVFGELGLLGLVLRRAAVASIPAPSPTTREEHKAARLTRLHGALVAKETGTWPFLTKATDRLLYYVNLHASRESTPVGKWTSREGVEIPTDVAVLIISGEVYLSENSGRRILMTEGSCFGEHILIGLPTQTLKIEPKTACELQMMNKQTFEKIMAECPEERDAAVQGILNEMAIKAEVKLGVARGASDILKRSALFRASSHEFLEQIRPRMYACLFKADKLLADEREVADCMFFIVRGHAAVLGDSRDEADAVLRFKAGTACCESAVLGTCSYFPYAVQAQSLCLTLALARTEFQAVLAKFPEEKQMFAKLSEDEESQDMLFSLPRVLKLHHQLFTTSSIDFLRKMCGLADEVYYAPSEIIIIRGESCAVGKTVMYVLLSGLAVVKLTFGEEVATIRPGMMVGEGGALGIADKRTTEICAHKETLVRCIRLQGASIRKAIDAHPEDCEALEETFKKRSQQNAQAEGKRREWLQSLVIPILRQCTLFSGFSMKLILKIAEPLLKSTWKELETGNIYIVTTPEDPVLHFLTVVNNPMKDDRREFEIQRGPEGRIQLLPLYLKDITTEPDTLSDLFLDPTVPGRIVWYSYTTGKRKTWQYMLQVWNTTLVQLMYEEEEDTVLRLVLRKLTGETISKVAVQPGTSWRDARKLMVPGLRPLLSKRLAFVSPLGEVLTTAHDEKRLSEILGLEGCKPEVDEDAWRKLMSRSCGGLEAPRFPEGKNLCTVGESADTMMTRSDGNPVGIGGRGFVIGELALMGLFPFRTATVTALKATDTVFVKSWNFQKMLGESAPAQDYIEKLDQEKRAQVIRGVPMAALPVTASPEDVCARAIALHSTRYILAPGEEWKVPPDPPAGAHNWVFARGRAVLLMGPADHPVNPILTLGAGGGVPLLPEPLPVKFGARVVAVTAVEAFRTSCMDMQLTTNSVKSMPSWYRRYLILEKQVTEQLGTKLIRSKAVIDMVSLHKEPIQLRSSRPVTAHSCEGSPESGSIFAKEDLVRSSPTLQRPLSRRELPPMGRPASQASLRPSARRPNAASNGPGLFPTPGHHRHADARKHLQSSQRRRDKAWKRDMEKVRFGGQSLHVE
ncbi:hypothetical protein AK812_SmicGene26738 [Symbiodinium microadriaticum]|uniref:Cyclic nucleotide-binding domain-containing protein n=1 Tax=Symbiodinium microadriaticum TaxID=2951 RepID=A0A1Q9D8U1_SYMMI|nr:hypothetical protein AK812_SmicGene26738 [Symbiodinium microadriaticum]